MKKDFLFLLKYRVSSPVKGDDSFIEIPVPVITVDIGNKERRINGHDPDTHKPIRLYYRPYEIVVRWPIRIQLQLHINRYEVGDCLSEHVDSLENGEWQYRIQFVLENARRGGELLCDRFMINRTWFKLFEPGRFKHEVTQVEEGRRRLLNFGIRFAPNSLSRCPF